MAALAPTVTNTPAPPRASQQSRKEASPTSTTAGKVKELAGKVGSFVGEGDLFSAKSKKNFTNLGTTYIDKTGSIYTKKVTWTGRAKQAAVISLVILRLCLKYIAPIIMLFVVYPALGLSIIALFTTPIGLAVIAGSLFISLISYLLKRFVIDKILLKEPQQEDPLPGIMLALLGPAASEDASSQEKQSSAQQDGGFAHNLLDELYKRSERLHRAEIV